MARYLRLFVLAAFACLCIGEGRAQEIGVLGEDDKEANGVVRYGGKGITDVEWSATRTRDGDSETVTKVLHSLAGSDRRSLIQETETRTRIDSETTQTIRTTSNFDSNGDTRVSEVVEEQHRVLENGEEHLERNISVPDSHGRLSVYRHEMKSTYPAGEDATRSLTSVYLPNISGEFEERERVHQSQSVTGDTIEIDETTQEIDANGRWTPRARRTVTSTQKNGQPIYEEEKIYRKDSRGRLSLSERIVSSQGVDAQGNQQWVVETHSNTIGGTRRTSGGKLQLNRRVKVTSRTLSGNVEQTIEEVEQRSPANPRSGLEVVERTITTSRPSRNGRELEIEVQARDSSGRFRTTMTQRRSVSQ